MDDELKGIQDDLDSLVGRLEEYIKANDGAYGLPETCSLLGISPEDGDSNIRAVARDTLYLYLTQRADRDLGRAWIQACEERGLSKASRWIRIDQFGEQKGRLIFALEAISNTPYKASQAIRPIFQLVQPEEMAILAEMATRYLNQQDKYLGEYGGEQILRRPGKRPRYSADQRQRAVNEYIQLREKHGKAAYPLDRETCQPIAEKYNIDSGQSVVDAVRDQLDEIIWESTKERKVMLIKLREKLDIKN